MEHSDGIEAQPCVIHFQSKQVICLLIKQHESTIFIEKFIFKKYEIFCFSPAHYRCGLRWAQTAQFFHLLENKAEFPKKSG